MTARKHASRGHHPARAARLTISACLIVCDEEANLHRCLPSLRNAVDQIVVLDTGSADATMAVAAEYGAQVFQAPWTDDFAAARNAALRHATGDWTLCIDADEELRQDQSDALRQYCARLPTGASGSLVTVDCPTDEQGLAGTVGELPRLLRNGQGIHFEGRVHEQPRAANGQTLGNLASVPANLRLYHWGYIPSGDLLPRKGERNRRLIGLSIAEEPDQPAHPFNLGRQLMWEGQAEEALPHLERAIEVWTAQGQPAGGYVPSMFSTAALAAMKQAAYQQVLDVFEATPKELVSSELLYVAGVASWRLGRSAEAIARLNRAWQDASLAASSGVDPSTAGWRPLVALAEIHASLGDSHRASEALDQAERFAPKHPAVSQARAQLQRNEEGQVRPQRVSACLIVRNEEANLERCLGWLQPAVDEIVLVDTGSTDRTVEIARECGARVFHFPWCDDFAAARNESLRHATGDWIIWIDADDELVEHEPGALRRLCQRAAADVAAYRMACHSVTAESGEVGVVLRQCRLFRNGRGVRFEGRVHEQPVLAGDATRDQDDVLVRHWGYVPSGDLLDQKCARNLRLLELEIADRPAEPLLRYNLGKQLVWQHQYGRALAALDRAVDLWEQDGRSPLPYVPSLFAVSACCALNLGQNERALDIEATCPAHTVSSDLLYYAAIACQRLSLLPEAVQRLERAISDPSVRTATETDPSTWSWRPLLLLSQIQLGLGRREEAYQLSKRAIGLMPERPDVLLSWAKQAWHSGHADDALEAAHRLLAGTNNEEHLAQTRQLLADIASAGSQPVLAGSAMGS